MRILCTYFLRQLLTADPASFANPSILILYFFFPCDIVATATRVASLADGSDAVVRRIDEQLEGQHVSMQTLERIAVLPGRAVKVVGRGTSALQLSVDGNEVELDLAIAERVYASLA